MRQEKTWEGEEGEGPKRCALGDCTREAHAQILGDQGLGPRQTRFLGRPLQHVRWRPSHLKGPHLTGFWVTANCWLHVRFLVSHRPHSLCEFEFGHQLLSLRS